MWTRVFGVFCRRVLLLLFRPARKESTGSFRKKSSKQQDAKAVYIKKLFKIVGKITDGLKEMKKCINVNRIG